MNKFLPEEMYKVLDKEKKAIDYLGCCDTEELCEVYKKLFEPNKNGYYELSAEHLSQLSHAMMDKSLLELVEEELVTMSWDDVSEEFVFSLTEEGKKAAERIINDN